MFSKQIVIKVLFLFFPLVFYSLYAQSQNLSLDSPERKQLIAMGYEIDKEDNGENWTIARIGSSSITLSKSRDRLSVSRIFTREKKLSSSEELELYKEINRINTDLSFQTLVLDETVWFVLYDYGDYNPKDFAKIVRLAEKADSVFDTYPKLLKLLNNE